jgi:hypothetical protein|tara:strand:+ start:1251 stop:1763 length:513 start_codon:yes stop_codon:yes gene_type:complete
MTEKNNVPIHLLSNVPNDEFGKGVIKNLRKFLNTDRYKVRVRGRGSRKEHGDASYIPLKNAEKFSIYVDHELMDYHNPHFNSNKLFQAERKIKELKDGIWKIYKGEINVKRDINEGYRFYSSHETLISANETVSILLNKTNYADIWGGYKIVKEKDCYVLYIAEKGETND